MTFIADVKISNQLIDLYWLNVLLIDPVDFPQCRHTASKICPLETGYKRLQSGKQWFR